MVTGVGLVVLAFVLVRDPWDSRGVVQVLALDGGDAVIVESTYSRSRFDREVTITRVDTAGVTRWETVFMANELVWDPVISLEPNPEHLILSFMTPKAQDVLRAISAKDGRTVWTLEGREKHAMANHAMSDASDLWTFGNGAVQRRRRDTGQVLWEASGPHFPIVVHDGAAVARDTALSRTGATRTIEALAGTGAQDEPCVVGDHVLGVHKQYRDGPNAIDTVLARVDMTGSVTTSVLDGDVPWRSSNPHGSEFAPANAGWVSLEGHLCGRSPSVDVVGFASWRGGRKQLALAGLEPGSATVRWSLPLGPRQSGGPAPRFVRLRDQRPLSRYLAVVTHSGDALRSLDLIDTDTGGVRWSLPLDPGAEFAPTVSASDCCLVIDEPTSRRLLVIDKTSGDLVKAVGLDDDFGFSPSYLKGDVFWLATRYRSGVHSYRLPDLVAAHPRAPRPPDLTEATRKGLVIPASPSRLP